MFKKRERIMRQPVRLFAIGLLTAGVIMLIGTFFFDNSTKQAENLSVKEMIPIMEDKGYHVITEEEYISMSVKKDHAQEATSEKNVNTDRAETTEKDNADKENNEKDKEASDKKEKEKDEKVTKYTINIKSGMLPSDISERLAENKIIDEANKFDAYLEKHNYSPKVQLGKFKVTSEMSFKEIAKKITR